MKKVQLRFESPGVQSYVYYLKRETNEKFRAKDRGGLPPWEFIQETADVTQTMSYGVCADHPEFKASASIDGSEYEAIEVEFVYPDCADELPADALQVADEYVEHNITDPDPSIEGVVFEYDRYGSGWIGCEIEVEDDFKWSEITLMTRSLDLNSRFYNEHVYASDANISDRAEMELHSVRYRGQKIEIGYDLSFAMCNAEMVYLERDDDGDFFTNYFTDVWDDEE